MPKIKNAEREPGKGPDSERHIVTPKTDVQADGPPEGGGSPTPITQRDTAAGVKTKYWSLKQGEDGAFDLSKMKDKSKAELREVFTKTARKGELGAQDVPDVFSPESMLGYVNLLMGIEASASVRFLKVEPQVAAEVFSLTPSEAMAIARPAAKVANKYLGDFKYADEMALIGAIAEVTFGKIALCRHRTELLREERMAAQRVNGHAQPEQNRNVA